MSNVHPIRLASSLHETIWGGRRLESDGWKTLPVGNVTIGESWETEINTIAQNPPYRGKTLQTLINESGPALLGEQALKIYGQRFPLLAKFIDANARLSVQVHPNDHYAAQHERGKLGKTEFWYVLAATPKATITHGFKSATSSKEVMQAIQNVTLESLIHEEPVQAGDVIFVPAGTVHAIGSGVMLYELQEYSDITYRLYDYGRRTADGKLRELHIEDSLAVTNYGVSPQIKANTVTLAGGANYEERCLVACKYFVTREINFKSSDVHAPYASLQRRTDKSCVILTSLGTELHIRYGQSLELSESLTRGETAVLPANLGNFSLEGSGKVLYSYVPLPEDEAWQRWVAQNKAFHD